MPGPAPARIFSVNVVHAVRGRIQNNSVGAAAGIEIGTIPAGSFVRSVSIDVVTAFNAGGTNVLQVGTAGAAEGFATGAGAAAGTAGMKLNLTGTLSGDRLTADTPVVVRFSETAGAGALSSAGTAVVLVEYYPHVT